MFRRTVFGKSFVSFLPLRVTVRTMSFLSVRRIEGEERLQISFEFGLENSKKRLFNFDRLQSETLQVTFARFQANISKFVEKKKKKAKKKTTAADSCKEGGDVDNSEIEIALMVEGNEVEKDVLNSIAWTEGATLKVADQTFDVMVNPPTVRSLTLPDVVMSGFPSYPNVGVEFVDLNNCRFKWFREACTEQSDKPSCSTDDNILGKRKTSPKGAGAQNIYSDWTEFHEGFCCMPSNEDIGCRVKVVCIPGSGSRQGLPVEAVSKATVEAGPGLCPFENRHQFTQRRAGPGQFRIMSYNILADVYSDSEYSRDYLFPYCPPYALDMAYRKHLLIKEMQGYNCDILCLQEVDRKVFLHDLFPVLDQMGYEGLQRLKAGEVCEGTATFFRRDKFKLLAQHDAVLLEELKNKHQELWEKCCTKEALKEKWEERTSTVQVTVLESVENPKKRVIVSTTHLYFHPRAAHIRVIQTYLCMKHMEELLPVYAVEGEMPAVIFCGDFNSYPEGGVHELLRTKRILSNHADWFTGGKEEHVDGLNLSHDLDLTCATGYPRYTNFVTGFVGCLDYIYVDKQRLSPISVVPMPSHEEVTEYTALPNVVFPSDHIAVICDVAWT